MPQVMERHQRRRVVRSVRILPGPHLHPSSNREIVRRFFICRCTAKTGNTRIAIVTPLTVDRIDPAQVVVRNGGRGRDGGYPGPPAQIPACSKRTWNHRRERRTEPILPAWHLGRLSPNERRHAGQAGQEPVVCKALMRAEGGWKTWRAE